MPHVTRIQGAEVGDAIISNYKNEMKQPLDPRLVELVPRWLASQVAGRGAADALTYSMRPPQPPHGSSETTPDSSQTPSPNLGLVSSRMV